MLHRRRPAVFLSVFTAGLLAFTPPAGAGCLCDWLFGRHTVAYPVAPAIPVAPVVPYAAQYPAGCAVPTAIQPTYYGAAAADAAPLAAPALPTPASTPAYSAQMPPYNVSAYGAAAAPTAVAPASYGAYYGSTAAAPQTAYYGAYPTAPTSYAAAYPTAPTSYAAAYPTTAASQVTNVAPVFAPQSNGGVLGGVGRFFGSLFGTRYQTSYYQAPVTYYRPVTSLQPGTGAAVVTQQPCTSYQYQVQRSPYSSFQLGHGQAATPQPVYGCVGTALPSAGDYVPNVPQPTLPTTSFDPYAAQSPAQVGSGYNGGTSSTSNCPPGASSSYGSANGYAPSNSYAPSTGYAPSNAYAPSTTHAPSSGNGYGAPGPLTGTPSDASRVDQPQLNGMPTTGASAAQPTWRQLPTGSASSWSSPAAAAAPQRDASPAPSSVRPIPAPPGYQVPPLETQAAPGDRTASQATWDVKTVQWRTSSSRPATASRTGLDIVEPHRAEPHHADARVVEPVGSLRRHSESMVAERQSYDAPTLMAPQQNIAAAAVDVPRNHAVDNDWRLRAPADIESRQPTAAPAPVRTHKVYDNSGWKPAR